MGMIPAKENTAAKAESRTQFLMPAIWSCTLILILTAVWYAQDLGLGELVAYDEYYTYARSLGFAQQNDWFAVYSLGEPTLKKPPLQYWMSAYLMELGFDDKLALRLPSLFFSLSTLIVTAGLARVLVPAHVWAMPASVLFLAGSYQFWFNATSALLDTGAAFFSTLGVLSIVLSLKDARWWPSFPVVVFLAGLQKGPTPLAFLLMAVIGLILTQRWHGVPLKSVFQSTKTRLSLILSVVLGFAWPLFQKIRFWGDDRLGGDLEREMLERFIPESTAALTNTVESFDRLILDNEPLVRLLGFVGLIALAISTKRPQHIACISIVLFFALIMIAAADKVFTRYTLTILPLLCVGAASLVFTVMPRPFIGSLCAIALAGLLIGPHRPASNSSILEWRQSVSPWSEILTPLNNSIQKDETPVLCKLIGRAIPPGAVWIYAPKAGSGRHMTIKSLETLKRNLRQYDGGPVRGVCRNAEIDLLRPYLQNLNVSSPMSGFVLWHADMIVIP